MKRLLSAALSGVVCVLVANASAATTWSVSPGQNDSAIQGVMDKALPGDTVLFAAGTYNITGILNLPCGTTITGPTGSQPTAILASTGQGHNIFGLSGCTQPTTISYLEFANTGGIYVTAPSSGLTVTYNEFVNLPANDSQWTDMGIYFDGTSGGAITGVTILDNIFGDPSSCTAVMSLNKDSGGSCDGIVFQGNLNGIVIEDNEFTHLEEGFHVLCYGNNCSGPTAPTWHGFTVQWNDFNNIHRIAMEMQPQNASNVTIQYNSYENAFAPSTFSMGISAACCAGLSATSTPVINDNVLIANVPPVGDYIAYAIEWWGTGAQANNDLIQGYWENGIVWGKGGPPWEVLNTIIEGPYMAGPWGCYLCNEKEGATTTPTQSGNVTSTTITPLVSVAPVISQSETAVSMSDTAINTSIYYTIDGSTPTTTSTLYSGPFTPPAGSTIKAIAMWGQGANPRSYPAGYGYVPSAVVSAVFAGAKASPTLQSISLAGSATLSAGGPGSQLTAIGAYSDGSQEPVTPSSWISSNTAACTVSADGLVAPVAAGSCAITAVFQSVTSTPLAITVQTAPPVLTYIAISANSTSVGVGATLSFTATGIYSDGTTTQLTPTWSTTKSSVATISANGILTAVAPGIVEVNAVLGTVSSTKPVSINVVSTDSIVGGYLSASVSGNTVAPCQSAQFTAYAILADGMVAVVAPVSWSTSNAAVGTITSSGLFTALVPGTVTVRAQLAANAPSNGWVVNVVAAPPATMPLAPGTYTVVVSPCGAATLSGTGFSITQ